jgi:hypothetical protein
MLLRSAFAATTEIIGGAFRRLVSQLKGCAGQGHCGGGGGCELTIPDT